MSDVTQEAEQIGLSTGGAEGANAMGSPVAAESTAACAAVGSEVGAPGPGLPESETALEVTDPPR